MYLFFKTFIITLLVVGYSIESHSQQDTTNENIGYLIGDAIRSYPLFEKKIGSNTHQGLCMRTIIQESKTTGFNIAREMEFLKDQLQALSGSHVVAMINQRLDALEDIRQEAIDIRERLTSLEDRLLSDCPEEDGIF